jgi:hypothetical protein
LYRVLNIGELSDLAGLIAPRPVLVEAVARRHFSIEHVKRTVAKARRAGKSWADKSETDYSKAVTASTVRRREFLATFHLETP